MRKRFMIFLGGGSELEKNAVQLKSKRALSSSDLIFCSESVMTNDGKF